MMSDKVTSSNSVESFVTSFFFLLITTITTFPHIITMLVCPFLSGFDEKDASIYAYNLEIYSSPLNNFFLNCVSYRKLIVRSNLVKSVVDGSFTHVYRYRSDRYISIHGLQRIYSNLVIDVWKKLLPYFVVLVLFRYFKQRWGCW